MAAQAPRTQWGGIADGKFRPGGYFQVAEHDGIFWLIDPDGGRFLSKGINTVRFDQDRIQNSDQIPYAEACERKYGNRDAWRASAARRLSRWGFNTLGAWSDEAVASAGPVPLAVTPNLDLGMSYGEQNNEPRGDRTKQDFPDVFDPTFDSFIRGRTRDLCGRRSEDQSIIGWFIDNELRWGPDWRGSDELLTLFLNLGIRSAGRAAVRSWLRKRYSDFGKFNSIWRTSAQSWDTFDQIRRVAPPYLRKPYYDRNAADEGAANRAELKRAAFAADCDDFSALVAQRYFALTCAAVKAADPNHLVLGCRFAYVPSSAVVNAAGRYNDVVSFNCYDFDARPLIETYATSGKPCLISEFSFRGADSGLPNTNGAGPVVVTQVERAACFRRYVAEALSERVLVGYHWFEHADQPAAGRFDGENSNFGTVTIDDRVYEDLTQTMTSLNAEAEDRHTGAVYAVA